MSSIAKRPSAETGTPNVFASPWKNSDLVLVVGETEFNVHRTILCLQSAVFEAMLNKDVEKEGKRDKITLEGKNPDHMCIFLKLLYPTKLLEKSLTEENFTQILSLAEEFKAVDVIELCLSEVKITAKNALEILPFASKYNKTLRQECIATVQKGMPSVSLKDGLLKLDRKDSDEILVGKCGLLESMLRQARRQLEESMGSHFKKDVYSGTRCPNSHSVSLNGFSAARKCELCLAAYRDMYCKTRPGDVSGSQPFIDLLKKIDDFAL